MIQPTIQTLRHLMTAVATSADGYTEAAKAIEDGSLRQQFNEAVNQRTTFAQDLAGRLRAIQGDDQPKLPPINTETDVFQAWMRVRDTLDGSRLALLEALHAADAQLVSDYEEALKQYMPEDVQDIIKTQHRTLIDARDRLEALAG